MNVAEMIRNVNAECKPITNLDSMIIRFLDRGQKIIFSKRTWGWSQVKGLSFNTITGVETYALSPLVDVSKFVTIYYPDGNTTLLWLTESEFRSKFPLNNTAQGNPYYARWNGFSPVQFQPVIPSALSFVSDDAVDTTQTIRVQGLDDIGIMVSETIDLDGINPVASIYNYSRIFALSKSAATTGTVTVTSDLGAIVNVRISPGERDISHPLVSLYSIPNAVKNLPYDFCLKAQTLAVATDVSLMPEQYHDAIELYGMARTFSHLNRKDLAREVLAEFNNRIVDMENDDNHARGIWSRDPAVGYGDNRTRERVILGI